MKIYEGRGRAYALAIGLTAIVFLLRLAFAGLLGTKVIFLPYLFVIIGAASLGGLGPGLVATLLAMVAGGFFLLNPRSGPPDYSQLVLFGLVGFLMSVVGESYHKARRKLEQQTQDLDAIKERLESTDLARAMALEAGRMGTWEWALSSNEVKWSPAMGQLYEMDEDSFPTSAEEYLTFVHPDDRERVQANLDEAVRAALPTFESRYRIVLRNGEVKWIASRGHSIVSNGALLGLRGVCWDVTEDAKADISQARLATIVSSSDDGIVSKDLNGKILTWNGGAEHIFGYSAEEMVGQSIQLLLPEDRLAEETEILAKLRKGESIKNLETVRKRKDGRLIDVTATISPIFDSTGRIVGVSKFVRDITEVKNAEKALRESRELLASQERQLQHLIDSIPVLISFVDADCKYRLVNKQYETWFKVRTSDMVGRHMSEVLGAEAYAVIEPYVKQVLSGEEVTYESEIPYAKPGKKFVRAHYVPNTDVNGKMDGFFVLVADHTGVHQRELDAKFIVNASATLANMVDYKATLTKIAELAVPYFADWCTIDVLGEDGNLERLAVAHRDPKKVQLAHDLYEQYPPDPSREQGVLHVMRTGVSELVSVITPKLIDASTDDPEVKQIIKDLGLYSYMCVPLRVKGKAIGAISFISAEMKRSYQETDLENAEDLARRASVSIENALLYQQLQDSDRRKDHFLATLAHELRNPLAPLRTGLDILGKSANDPKLVIEVHQVMERQLTQLVRLVDDLLDINRITTGKLELRKEATSVESIVENAVEANRGLLEQRTQSLLVNPLGDLPEVFVDPARITQVLQNLLNNASKYTDPGGTIQLTIEHDGSELTFTVKDNGIGIDPEHSAWVFDMFSQVESPMTKAYGGLGIGLALVKGLVEMHGGKVEVKSEGVGQGSEFCVRLPAEACISAINMTDEPSPDSRSKRVLVVDDNNDIADMLGRMLKLVGNEVEIANDGAHAIERCREFKPDVVLLDIGMPGMSGYDVAKGLRSEPWGKNVVLIALTGWGSQEDRDRTKEAGFDHHLVKPVQLADLEKLL